MDFDEAIAAHVGWKAKLRSYITHADKSLDASVIEKDNLCSLGKWIYSEGLKYKSSQHYTELVSEHAKFHKCAALIVRHIDAGKKKEAEEMIGANSEYSEISMEVVTKIRKLRREIEK
jgi:hypothetical protein